MGYTAFDRCAPELARRGICFEAPASAGKMWTRKMAETAGKKQEAWWRLVRKVTCAGLARALADRRRLAHKEAEAVRAGTRTGSGVER